MSDHLREMVDRAVALTQEGPSKEALESLAPLAELDPSTLLPELFLQVEEASRDIDLSSLRPTELVPDVDFARNMIHAIIDDHPDPDRIRSVVRGSYPDLVIELISIVAALKSSAN